VIVMVEMKERGNRSSPQTPTLQQDDTKQHSENKVLCEDNGCMWRGLNLDKNLPKTEVV